MPETASSLALVPLVVTTIALLGYPLFRRGFGFDPVTLWYKAMPGGFEDILILQR